MTTRTAGVAPGGVQRRPSRQLVSVGAAYRSGKDRQRAERERKRAEEARKKAAVDLAEKLEGLLVRVEEAAGQGIDGHGISELLATNAALSWSGLL